MDPITLIYIAKVIDLVAYGIKSSTEAYQAIATLQRESRNPTQSEIEELNDAIYANSKIIKQKTKKKGE